MNLIMKDCADKSWLKPNTPVTAIKPVLHSLILTVCATAIVIMVVVVTVKTAMASPAIKIDHYSLVDQNGEE